MGRVRVVLAANLKSVSPEDHICSCRQGGTYDHTLRMDVSTTVASATGFRLPHWLRSHHKDQLTRPYYIYLSAV
jgi:hypothetical protein